MYCMFATPFTEFFILQLSFNFFLVLARVIIPPLTIGAPHCY